MTIPSTIARRTILLFCLSAIIATLLFGCGKEESKTVPRGAIYYEGPMKRHAKGGGGS